jgi:hypothetical protein
MESSLTVVGLGCELDRLFAGQPPALPIPVAPSRDDLRELYDAIAGCVRAGDAVVVILGDWMPEDALERVRTVRSLVQSDRVAIHVTDLPPLATSVLAAVAAALAPLSPAPGVLISALDVIGSHLQVLAWAGSVANLSHPSVSLRHHARSLLPGATFAIGLQPESFVLPISAKRPELPLAVPEHPVEILAAPSAKGDISWLLKVVSPALGGAPVREIPATMYGEQWWGTPRLVEAVGVPTSLEWLADVAFSGPAAPCAWCDELILSTPCPFCGGALVRGSRRSAATRR